MRYFIYSLRELCGKSILSIDLGNHILPGSDENDQEYLVLKLGGELFSFRKRAYTNSMRIIEKSGFVFTICTKSVDRNFVKNKLIEYKISKLETEADHILMMKKRLQQEMVAA